MNKRGKEIFNHLNNYCNIVKNTAHQSEDDE